VVLQRVKSAKPASRGPPAAPDPRSRARLGLSRARPSGQETPQPTPPSTRTRSRSPGCSPRPGEHASPRIALAESVLNDINAEIRRQHPRADVEPLAEWVRDTITARDTPLEARWRPPASEVYTA
jgi:hypothetical protein